MLTGAKIPITSRAKIVSCFLENSYRRSTLDPTFFPGRAAEIVYCNGDGKQVVLGVLGVLHPEVLAKFELNLPCCALELNIEHFV